MAARRSSRFRKDTTLGPFHTGTWFFQPGHADDMRLLRYAAFGILVDDEIAARGVRHAADSRDRWLDEHGPDDLSDDELTELLTDIVRVALDRGRDGVLTLGLSGGFDSRPLLHVLRTLGQSPRLFTYGSPGNIDYDVVGLIQERTDLEVEVIDTNQVAWSLELMDEYSAATLNVQLSPAALAWTAMNRAYPGRRDVNGFLNDTITGDNREKADGSRHRDAVSGFIARNDPHRFHQLLGARTVRDLVPTAAVDASRSLDLYRQYDIAYRQYSRIRPPTSEHVTYLTPYEDPRWVGYWLSRPPSAAAEQRVWLNFIRSLPTDLFADLEGLDLEGKALRRARRDRLYGWRGYDPLRPPIPPGVTPPANPLYHFDTYACSRNNASFARMIGESVRRLRGRRVIRDDVIDRMLAGFERGERVAVQMVDGLVGIDMAFAGGHLD